MIPTANDKTDLFEKMPIPKALATMAIPTIISQLITTIYNIADTAFIGMTNDPYKVAAASLVSVIFFLTSALANLFGVGGGSMVSRLLGRKMENEAKKVYAFSIYGALGIAALYSFFCYIFADSVVYLLGASENTMKYAKSYLLWVVIIGGIPATVSITMSHLIRCAGYARESSIGLAIGGVSNVILDPLLMFVILPPGYEVTGAAVATMLSNIFTLVYFAVLIVKHEKDSVLSLSVKEAKPMKESILEVFVVGFPSAISSLLGSVSSIVRMNLTSNYGDIEIAAYGIVNKLDMIPLNIGMGLCQGMMPLVGYNYASQDYKRMHGFTKAAQLSGVIAAALFICMCQLFSRQIIGFFIQEDQTVAYGSSFLRIACFATPFIVSNFQKIYCLQAMGKGRESLILSITRQGVLAIPVMFIMNHVAGLYGLVSAQTISDSITLVFATFLYKKLYGDLVKSSLKT